MRALCRRLDRSVFLFTVVAHEFLAVILSSTRSRPCVPSTREVDVHALVGNLSWCTRTHSLLQSILRCTKARTLARNNDRDEPSAGIAAILRITNSEQADNQVKNASENLGVFKGLAKATCLPQRSIHSFAPIQKKNPDALVHRDKDWERDVKQPSKHIRILIADERSKYLDIMAIPVNAYRVESVCR
jgi:hypothetical protein